MAVFVGVFLASLTLLRGKHPVSRINSWPLFHSFIGLSSVAVFCIYSRGLSLTSLRVGITSLDHSAFHSHCFCRLFTGVMHLPGIDRGYGITASFFHPAFSKCNTGTQNNVATSKSDFQVPSGCNHCNNYCHGIILLECAGKQMFSIPKWLPLISHSIPHYCLVERKSTSAL